MIISNINMNPEKYFIIFSNDKNNIIYRFKGDYFDYSIFFDLKDKSYSFCFEHFIDNEEGSLVPMEKRGKDDFSKHCCHYGHWQRIDLDINIELHNFVSKIMKELGWID